LPGSGLWDILLADRRLAGVFAAGVAGAASAGGARAIPSCFIYGRVRAAFMRRGKAAG
jgi:hypothetical protein